MSYEQDYTPPRPRSLAERWRALSLPWKVALCAAALFVLVSALGDDAPADRPPCLAVGAVLTGLQLAGEKPLYHEDGIEVVDASGPWIEVRIGPDEASRRWFQLDHVAGFKMR